MRRTWKIEVADNQLIKLDWSFLDVEYDKQCERDWVTIKGSRKSRTVASYCGNKLPAGYLSPRNKLFIEFRSDKKNVGTGFKLHYQAVSGKMI